MAITDKIVDGIGSTLRELMNGKQTGVRDKGDRLTPQQKAPGYPIDKPIDERIKYLGWKFYKEGAFEKVQFSRKWMRNALIFQGYHELEWSEINVAWEAILRDSGDFAFPNNYYRSHVMYGASLYVKNAPEFIFQPISDDFEAQAVSEACQRAFEVIKENVNYDALRVEEAVYLRLFGNTFRYSYYSLDSRFGEVVSPEYERVPQAVDDGSFVCPSCGYMGAGNPLVCPQCMETLDTTALVPPRIVEVPKQVGVKRYPRGQECTEVVSPLEVGLRVSAPNLWKSPYLYRARIVDKMALQAEFPDVDFGVGSGETGGAVAASAATDLSLLYQQSLADLPGDPTQYAAWYERATSFSRVMLLEVWIRPSQYAHDQELLKQYPDGLYACIVGDKLPKTRNEALDDHWIHIPYIKVPGRIWGDGDDDLIPKQLQLNETERLIMRSQAFISSPQLVIDPQRIDRDSIVNDPAEIIECKNTMGRPVSDSFVQVQGQQLPQETWRWREAELADMDYHSGVFGSSIGQHQAGVNTFGGQEQMATRAEQTLSPLLLAYKGENEKWCEQMLKLAAANWVDDRINAVEGINGNWEFKKLRSDMLQLDKVKIRAKLIPIDYAQQQGLAQAVATGLLNPQDQRVQRKALELYQLPAELTQFSMDSKSQWLEIEKMKQGQMVQPQLLTDNDPVHIEICRVWLNSDEARNSEPQIVAMVYQHLQLHVANQMKASQVEAALQMAPQEAAQAILGAGATQGMTVAPGAPAAGNVGQRAVPAAPGQPTQEHPQAGRHGGQVPPQASDRESRAVKGQAAKPNRPQPPHGNQYGKR